MEKATTTAGFKCTVKEKESMETMARSLNITLSEYLKLRVSEPRIPKKVKSRDAVRSLFRSSEILYSEDFQLSDMEKTDIIKAVPDRFHFWELADCDGEPCRYRNGILVNFYGTFLTTDELPVDDKDWTEGYIAEDEWEIVGDNSVSFDRVIQIELESRRGGKKQDEALWIL